MQRVLVVGCEVEDVEEGIGLSETVSRSLPAAVELVCRLVDEVASGGREVEVGAGPPASLGRSTPSRRKDAT